MTEQLLRNFSEQVFIATKEKGWAGRTGDNDTNRQWTFAESLLFSVTVVTTIGKLHAYGNLLYSVNVQDWIMTDGPSK